MGLGLSAQLEPAYLEITIERDHRARTAQATTKPKLNQFHFQSRSGF